MVGTTSLSATFEQQKKGNKRRLGRPPMSTRQNMEQECIFCATHFIPKKSNHLSPLPNFIGKPKVESNLSAMFQLLRILEIPPSVCEPYIKKFGNPDKWFFSCSSCSILAFEAMSILFQVQALRKSFREIQDRLKLKIQKLPNHGSGILGKFRRFALANGIKTNFKLH